MTIWLYESYDGMMDWWPSPNSWTSVDNPADYRTCVQTVHTVHLGHLGLVVKKHSFCFFPKNICSIINGLIINGVIINGLITNGLITNGLITNGLIILVDHMSQYHECFQQDWHIWSQMAHAPFIAPKWISASSHYSSGVITPKRENSHDTLKSRNTYLIIYPLVI